jgi:hypothetical protein
MPEPTINESLWNKGVSLLESQLGPVQTLQFMAMVSRQSFDYQQWREERFGKSNVDEILEQATVKDRQ